MTGVLVKKKKKGKYGHGDRHAQRDNGVKKHRERMPIYKSKMEGGLEQTLPPSPPTPSSWTLSVENQESEPPSFWYLVTTGWKANTVYRVRHKEKSSWGELRWEQKTETGTTLLKGLREKGLDRNTVLSF